MTHKRLLVLTTTILLGAGFLRPALGDVRRERSERHPTVKDIGQPYSISMATLGRESEKLSDLRDFIIRNGYPDYAEVQEVAPEWPWESYEIRVYYMHWNLEVDFGRVLFSDAVSDLGVEKFQGEITPEKRHEIDVVLQARQAPPPVPPVLEAPAPPAVPMAPVAPAEPAAAATSDSNLETLVARLEAAADRASRAADLAVEQSEAAVRAADRAVDVVDKLDESAPVKVR